MACETWVSVYSICACSKHVHAMGSSLEGVVVARLVNVSRVSGGQ